MSITLGVELDDITRRLDAATDAWVAAGHPMTGPEHDAREAVFADLHDWTRRVSGSPSAAQEDR